MKLTRLQLRKIIQEVTQNAELSQKEIDAAKKKLSDEGGAAGPDMVAQAAKNATSGDEDEDVSDKAVINALIKLAPDDFALHGDGDVINPKGIKNNAG